MDGPTVAFFAVWALVVVPLVLRTFYRVIQDKSRFVWLALWLVTGLALWVTSIGLIIEDQDHSAWLVFAFAAEILGAHLLVHRRVWTEVSLRWWGWLPPWSSRKLTGGFMWLGGFALCGFGIVALWQWIGS